MLARKNVRRFASPLAVGVGILFGTAYTLAFYWDLDFEARLVLASSFVVAGLCGLYYTFSTSPGRYTSYIMDVLSVFFFLWLGLGAVFLLRAFFGASGATGDVNAITNFIVGWISGTVLVLSVILVIGAKKNIGAWDVIRFPVWILVFLEWLTRRGK